MVPGNRRHRAEQSQLRLTRASFRATDGSGFNATRPCSVMPIAGSRTELSNAGLTQQTKNRPTPNPAAGGTFRNAKVHVYGAQQYGQRIPHAQSADQSQEHRLSAPDAANQMRLRHRRIPAERHAGPAQRAVRRCWRGLFRDAPQMYESTTTGTATGQQSGFFRSRFWAQITAGTGGSATYSRPEF